MRDTLSHGTLRVSVSAGLHSLYGARYIGGAATVRYKGLFLEGMRTGQPLSWVARRGFGKYLEGKSGLEPGRLHQVRLGMGSNSRWIAARASGFAQRHSDISDWYLVGPDSVAALSAGADVIGASASVILREEADRGPYTHLEQLILRENLGEMSLFTNGRLGVRSVFFLTIYCWTSRFDIGTGGR